MVFDRRGRFESPQVNCVRILTLGGPMVWVRLVVYEILVCKADAVPLKSARLILIS